MNKPTIEPLRKRSDYLNASKAGYSYTAPAFILQIYKRTPEGSIRYGITASRKIGGAVERNRAKRRLRALLRPLLPELGQPGTDYVFIARKQVLTRNFALMGQELTQAINKIS